MRKKTRAVKIGNVRIGGGSPIAIQSMAKAGTADIDKVIAQVERLKNAGCQIVRLAVKDDKDALALKKIKEAVDLPIVADIHFNWRLALAAIDSGVDKIRLNPGNIYKDNELKEIIAALKSAGIPLRIGVNSGSVPALGSKKLSMPARLLRSALDYISRIEKLKFYDIVISLKASGVLDTVQAYRQVSKACDYPLHLGLTATGLPRQGSVKSAIAIGALLMEGIGDTIRVSLTEEPEEEVKVAQSILEALGLGQFGPEVISCPTCGRCEVDLRGIVRELEDRLHAPGCPPMLPLKIAVMGCVVNGPGEAKEADIGIAFGKSEGLLFKNGKAVKKVSASGCLNTLLKELCSGQRR